ncbi:MAG: YbhB/YbcL family Raf kinase inhibitor-like protein [Calditrichia bacterium]
MSFTLTSPAFQEGGSIPSLYTCDGKDISPALKWENPPEGTVAYALICDDPDAPVGTWVHWVIYNIPGNYRELPEAMPTDARLKEGILHGKNSWNRFGYGGPCPPGGTHRYFFKLYALDSPLQAKEGLTKEKLLELMKGHILGECQLMGRYARQK